MHKHHSERPQRPGLKGLPAHLILSKGRGSWKDEKLENSKVTIKRVRHPEIEGYLVETAALKV